MNEDKSAAFKEVGDRKAPWQERLEVIQEQFPSVVQLDWKRLFGQDPAVMGRIVGDILKVDQATPGRVGKRAALDQDQAEARLRQLTGQDYTVRPFHEAFQTLVGARSLRAMASRLGVSHTYVRRLLTNQAQPDAYLMEKIAAVFKKAPEYFLEYRVAYVLGMLAQQMEDHPEATVALFRKIRAAAA